MAHMVTHEVEGSLSSFCLPSQGVAEGSASSCFAAGSDTAKLMTDASQSRALELGGEYEGQALHPDLGELGGARHTMRL